MEVFWITLGLLGTVICGVALLCVMRGKLDATSWKFPVINMVCSCMILSSLIGQFSVTLLGIELFWFSMSFYGFIRALGEKK